MQSFVFHAELRSYKLLPPHGTLLTKAMNIIDKKEYGAQMIRFERYITRPAIVVVPISLSESMFKVKFTAIGQHF